MTLGEKVINEIIQQGMIQVAHPDPSEPHVFAWSANSAEQIEAVVLNHIEEDLEQHGFDK